MQDGEGAASGQAQAEQAFLAPAESLPNTVAVEIAAVDDDIMDTTPDTDQRLVLPNGSANNGSNLAVEPSSPTTNSAEVEEAESIVQTEPAPFASETVGDFQLSFFELTD